jgi:predicted transposase/invertase (TIGR01784 family)
MYDFLAEPRAVYHGAGTFADLGMDVAFKKALNPDGSSSDTLVAVTNDVLGSELALPVRTLRSRDKERGRGTDENRRTMFDIHCTDQLGRRFFVERQQERQDFIVDRAIFYAMQLVEESGGNGPGFDYRYSPVTALLFLDFRRWKDDAIIHTGKLRTASGDTLADTLTLAFVELPKFEKGLGELETRLDHWLFALRHIQDLDERPAEFSGDLYTDLFEKARQSHFTKEEWLMFTQEQKERWDRNSIINTARREGWDEGLALGEQRGEKRGLTLGEKRGLARLRSAAKALLKSRVPLKTIAESTGFSPEEIKAL